MRKVNLLILLILSGLSLTSCVVEQKEYHVSFTRCDGSTGSTNYVGQEPRISYWSDIGKSSLSEGDRIIAQRVCEINGVKITTIVNSYGREN